MYIHRNNPDMKGGEPMDEQGSSFGGILSVVYYIAMLGYAVVLLIAMFKGQSDNISTQPLPNPFEQGYETMDLFNGSFMPFLQILKMNENHPTDSFDVFREDHQGYSVFEMEKLKDYLEVVIDIRTRKNDKTGKSD